MAIVYPANLEDLGTSITGLVADVHRFVTVMSFKRLERLVSNPLIASQQKFRDASVNLQEYYDLHSEIQRAFDKGKKENAEDYSKYIIDIKNGAHGDTPTIDLYTPKALTVIPGDGDSKSAIIWEHGLVAVPYDGETQLAARFLAAAADDATRDMKVLVTIVHGKPVEFARQCFHDRNAYQRRATSGVALAMDSRDLMIRIVRKIEASTPKAVGVIEWKARQMPKGNSDLIAMASFVRTAVVCFAHGIQGVQLETSELPQGLSEEQFTARAVLWFSKVINKVAPFMKDREHYVCSSPAVWAALGAIGNALVSSDIKDDATLRTMADGLVSKLDSVDWNKGEAWIGVAIKKASKGYSFAGGAKDSGTIAFKALGDEGSPYYNRIRGVPATA
jgi:hypothetical protein